MTDRAPASAANLDTYGNPNLPWSRPHDLLIAGGTHVAILGTSRPDGRPHAAIVGVAWHDGDLYFSSGARAR
jgi:hypothetical protein